VVPFHTEMSVCPLYNINIVCWLFYTVAVIINKAVIFVEISRFLALDFDNRNRLATFVFV